MSGEAGASSVTTYRISGAGSLSDAKSATDGQGALCWIERVGSVFFVSNTATNNLSSFSLGPNGQRDGVGHAAAGKPEHELNQLALRRS